MLRLFAVSVFLVCLAAVVAAQTPGIVYIRTSRPKAPVLYDGKEVFKVGGSIYRGQLKVIAAPNPLSEQVTFQHTADLAGRASSIPVLPDSMLSYISMGDAKGPPPECDAIPTRTEMPGTISAFPTSSTIWPESINPS